MMNQLQIPADLREKIDRELAPGEVIRWIQQPIARFFTPASIFFFLFGIHWTAGVSGATFPTAWGAVFTPVMLTSLLFMPFIMGLFLFIGFSCLLAPLCAKKVSLKTVYIITDRRAISFEGVRTVTIRSYLPSQLKNIYRQEKKDGSGNIILTIYYIKDSDGDERKEYIGFMDIQDPKGAEKYLKELADINIE